MNQSKRPFGRHRRLKLESLEGRRLLATYYVSQVDGDDTSTGTSETEAWASIARLEQQTLLPGDVVLLKRGSAWNEYWEQDFSGNAANPILVQTYGQGDAPILNRLRINGSHTHLFDIIVDHNKQSGDAVIVRAPGVMLKDMIVRNGANDGIDANDADGLVIDGLLIHHFLAGSFTNQVDAHGIVATDTRGLTIRNTEVHHVSGDSFQADPDRNTTITTDILIEGSHFWTGPLAEAFNEWNAGERPGENAVDTKMVKSGWESVERMKITIRDVVAHGWVQDGYINNKAVFNMKEKIEAVFDGITVYDSEIAFRLRGTRGNADVTIANAVVYDVDKAIRAEDDLANLQVYNTTFGDGIDTMLQFAGGSGGTGSWDLRNNAFVGSIPSVASDPSNVLATAADFADAANRDYRLANHSSLIDSGVAIVGVDIDREGNQRPQGTAHDIGAYEKPSVQPAVVDEVIINQGDVQRSSVDEITIVFNQIVQLVLSNGSPFTIMNKTTGETVATESQIEQIDGKTVVTLTFLPGSSVTATGSLADGQYELSIDASAVSSDGVALDGTGNGDIGQDFVFGDDQADQFFRKYGDVDGSGRVDLFDFAQFRQAYAATEQESRYRSEFDSNGDGIIDLFDFAVFRSNFNT